MTAVGPVTVFRTSRKLPLVIEETDSRLHASSLNSAVGSGYPKLDFCDCLRECSQSDCLGLPKCSFVLLLR